MDCSFFSFSWLWDLYNVICNDGKRRKLVQVGGLENLKLYQKIECKCSCKRELKFKKIKPIRVKGEEIIRR